MGTSLVSFGCHLVYLFGRLGGSGHEVATCRTYKSYCHRLGYFRHYVLALSHHLGSLQYLVLVSFSLSLVLLVPSSISPIQTSNASPFVIQLTPLEQQCYSGIKSQNSIVPVFSYHYP